MANKDKTACRISKRWLLCFITFLGYLCMYINRVNLNLAIVCMVRTPIDNSTQSSWSHGPTSANQTQSGEIVLDEQPKVKQPCMEEISEQKLEYDRAEFDYDKTMISTLISSYYYGLAFTQLLGGWSSTRFGSKVVITMAMTLQGVCSFIIPVAARTSVYFLLVLRVIVGLGGGLMIPAFYNQWSKWAPIEERGLMISVSSSGGMVGTVIAYTTSGLLCAYGFDNGWGSIFYLHGVLTALFIIIWLIFVEDSPETHPGITAEERDLICQESSPSSNNRKVMSIPWKSILTSPAVLVLMLTQTCTCWSSYTILTVLPLFMKEVLKFDVKQNGALSSLPHIVLAITMLVIGYLCKAVQKNGMLSTRTLRKLAQSTSFLGLSLCLIGVSFVTCEHKTLAVILMSLANGFIGFSQGGYIPNVVDFAPRFAGVIYGVTVSFSSVTGMLAPLAAGLLTPNGTHEEWNNVLYLCVAISVFGCVIFGFFSRTEVQPWADDNTKEDLIIPPADKMRDRNKAFLSAEVLGSLEGISKV